MVTRKWKVYGREGHRQRESFNKSYEYDFSGGSDGTRIIKVENADVTGTNEYTVVTITRDTAELCAKELDGQITDGIVEIIEHYNNMYDHRISVKYKKDAEFTVLVKSCGFSWDGNEWYRKISRSTGKFKDMAEELGNKLLENGFVIYIQKDKNAYIKLNEKAFNL